MSFAGESTRAIVAFVSRSARAWDVACDSGRNTTGESNLSLGAWGGLKARIEPRRDLTTSTGYLPNDLFWCMMYVSSLSLGYYKLLRILSDSYQVLDDPGSN